MTEFHFLRPYWLLALIPAAGLLWMLVKHKKGSQLWKSICDPELLPYILISGDRSTSRVPIVIVAIAGMLVILALAGPVWEKNQQPVFRADSALVIVLDLSLSMNAADVTPTRVDRAKHKIIDLLRRRGDGQTALVVYALEAFTVSPLTQDTKTIELLVPTLSVDLMPGQGSQPDLAIDRAKELLQQAGSTHGHVLLITDSASSDKLVDSVRQLTANGHRLSVLGVGTAEGAPISLPDGGFLKDITGSIVIPKLDSSSLSLIAGIGGGRYQTMTGNDDDINGLVKLIDSEFKLGQISQQQHSLDMQADVWVEEGPWLLLIVIPFAALYFRRGWMLVLFLLCLPVPTTSYALSWDDLWSTPDQKGQKHFNAGELEDALDNFEDEQWQATTFFKQKNYSQALEKLSNVDTSDGYYNRGNTLAKLGKLQEAIASYDEAIKRNPENSDAIYNRDLLQKYLDKQQQDKKQDQKQGDEQDQNKGDKQKEQDGKKEGDNKPSENSDDKSKTDSSSSENKSDDEMTEKQKRSADSDKQDQEKANQQNGQSDDQKEEEQKKQDQSKDEQKQDAQKKDELSQSQEQEKDKQAKDSDKTLAQQAEQKDDLKVDEKQRAIAQWLRRVPDDPGGLLRRKFRYQSQVRGGQVKGTKPW